MARYARLRELGFEMDDSELFEVFDKFTDGDNARQGRHAAEAERAHQQKSIRGHLYTVPSTELATEIFGQLPHSKGYPDNNGFAQQHEQELQEKLQNLENGNPNVAHPDPTTQPTVVAICSHSSTAAATGASLQEQRQQGGGRRGVWVGRNIEERSSRRRTMGCESYLRDNSASVLDNSVSINSNTPSSMRRGTSYRDREPALDLHKSQEPFSSQVGTQPQHSQLQETQSCTLHSSCADIRHNFQRFSKESSQQEGRLNAPIPGPEQRSLPSVMPPRSDASDCGGSFAQERGPIFQRSSSAREAAGLQRSSSTRGQRSEMSTENWRDHAASKSTPVSVRTKHRVSFSLTENHEVETQKLREKFRESAVAPCKKVSREKQHSSSNKQPLRYNYEQPGFVEREKENISAGKAYTIYGVEEVKDCPKATSGRHHQFVRAFSLRENASNYTKMPRAYSVNSGGRHVMPMQCETCGKGGIGIVCLGFPEDDASNCQACRCGESKPPKKKKSIMDYCRKLLRLPQKHR